MCNQQAFHQKWAAHQAKHRHFRRRRHQGWGRTYPPVNVKELDERYELYVFAPDLAKDDFKITLKDRILSIVVDKKEADTEEKGTWKRKEYSPSGFQRQFELNEKIDVESINAEYEVGVLKVILHKLEGMETFRNDIPVV